MSVVKTVVDTPKGSVMSRGQEVSVVNPQDVNLSHYSRCWTSIAFEGPILGSKCPVGGEVYGQRSGSDGGHELAGI